MGDCWFQVPVRIAEGTRLRVLGEPMFILQLGLLLGATRARFNDVWEWQSFIRNLWLGLLREYFISLKENGGEFRELVRNVADLDWQEFDSPTRRTAEISESSDLLVDLSIGKEFYWSRMTDSWQDLGI